MNKILFAHISLLPLIPAQLNRFDQCRKPEAGRPHQAALLAADVFTAALHSSILVPGCCNPAYEGNIEKMWFRRSNRSQKEGLGA
jgi:hypothetical protein